jgi:filamentous hemagglutinin family protein
MLCLLLNSYSKSFGCWGEDKVKNILWGRKFWRFSAAVLLGWTSTLATSISPSFAQSNIAPDETLGTTESSQITPNFNSTPNEVITGGAQRQQNLFHSFREFNVSENRGAYFLVPNTDTQNILVRVTGSNRSDIFGVLGTRQAGNFAASNANLFLMNPNGIVFGENARLDLGGSFVGTTANAIQFGEQGFYNASGGQLADVLTINPSAFLFNQINPASIANQSRTINNTNPALTGGLRVTSGRSLLFLGGSVILDGGVLNAPDGRIELGGLAEAGKVELSFDGTNLDLIFPVDVVKANILLSNRASLDTSGVGGGRVEMQGNNINLSENTRISSTTLGNQNGKGVNIQASELNISGLSNINTTTIGSGNSGDILIDTENLNLLDASSINTLSFVALGNTGNITVKASSSVNLADTSSLATISIGKGSAVTGSAGNVAIDTKRLNLQNQSSIIAQSFSGQANAGNLSIKATDAVNLNNSLIAASSFGVGATGNISIETRNLNIREGTIITTSIINPSRVDLESVNINTFVDLFSNGQPALRETLVTFILNLFATIEAGNTSNFEQAKAGNINIFASDSVVLSKQSSMGNINIISTATFGSGSAGNITVESGKLIVRDASLITSQTTDIGQGGNITLTASDSIKLINTESGLSTSTSGTGFAGNIKIFTTGNLTIQDGAQVASSTISKGRGGNIDITADTIKIAGLSAKGFSSGVQSQTFGLASSANAGEIKLTSRLLSINDGGRISTGSTNQGQAGKITIRVDESLSASDGGISSSSKQSSGGNVEIDARDIRLFGNSDISTFVSSGSGGGGDIKLTANTILAFGNSDILAFAQDGEGGNITLKTPAFFGENYRPSPSDTDPRSLWDNNNMVDINASGAVSGVISLPDTSFIQNNLTELNKDVIDTNLLIANSCIARNQKDGTFYVTGSGGLPVRPGDTPLAAYPTGQVSNIPEVSEPDKSPTSSNRPWKIGDPIVEPEGMYQLTDGKIIMSSECP